MKYCLKCHQEFDIEGWQCPHCKHTPVMHNHIPILAPHIDAHYPLEGFGRLSRAENRGYFWFMVRTKLLVTQIQRYFPQMANYMEIGCGTGFLLSQIERAYPNAQLTGTDIYPKALEFAAQNTQKPLYIQMDALNIPYREEFDVIGIYDVLEHIVDDKEVLRQIHTALKPQAGLVITVPQHQFLWNFRDEHGGHQRRYSRKDLVQKVQQAGFEVINVTSFMSLLVFMTLLYSRRLPKNPEEYTAPQYNISQLSNKILYTIFNLEYQFIHHLRLSLPFGTSLLLVARKRNL